MYHYISSELTIMKKEELITRFLRLQEECENLEGRLSDIDGFYSEMEQENGKLHLRIEELEGNVNLESLIYQMWLDGKLSPDLEEYLRSVKL